jgi:cytosine/adenosine deaminase-related metal-dependent hydrolase
MAFTLTGARAWDEGRLVPIEVAVRGGRIAAPSRGLPRADLEGLVLLPGLVNGHDHLDFSTFPALGRPPYASLYAWTDEVRAGRDDPRAAAARRVPLADRVWLGALRNLLAGATAVVHHGPVGGAAGASLGAIARRAVHAVRHGRWPALPVRVLRRYAQAHSPGLEPDLARTRPRSSRVPWMIHAGEGTDARARGEIRALANAGLLAPNTVLVHAVGLGPSDVAAVRDAGAAVVWCPESNRHLYGATAPAALLRREGVRIGLGSDSPLSGVRDPLSNLAAARAEGVLDDAALLHLATRETAFLFGLPSGGVAPGEAADLVAVDEVARFLAGDRRSIRLVVAAGRPLYGSPEIMGPLGVASTPLVVDGMERRVEIGLGKRLRRLRRTHPQIAAAAWLADVFAP